MALITRKRAMLAKSETTYGVDSVPVGADAMLIKNLNVNPIQAELVSRDLIKPYLGNSESLLTQTFVQLDFEVEFVGSGAPGRAPAYDPLLQACGFVPQPIETVDVALEQTAGVAKGTTLSSHGLVVGDKVMISGATPTAYNGVQTVTAVPSATTFNFSISGSTASPATGLPKLGKSLTYAPISEGFTSCTIYYYADTVLHKVTGCFGSFEVSVSVRQIPTFKFNFTGLYNSPTDTVSPVVDFSDFMIPQVANTQNTPGFEMYGFSANLSEFTLNMQNDVQYITLIGSESVKLLDRKPQGQLVFEAPNIGDKDFFSLVRASETGTMSMSHGSKAGYKVDLVAPSILLGNPTYQDLNGVQMLSAPFTLTPIDGNDELQIKFY